MFRGGNRLHHAVHPSWTPKQMAFCSWRPPRTLSFSFQGFPWWAVLLRKNHLGELLGPLEIKALSPGGLEDTALPAVLLPWGTSKESCVFKEFLLCRLGHRSKAVKGGSTGRMHTSRRVESSWRKVGFASAKRRSTSACGW